MTNKNRGKSAGGGMGLPTLLLIIFIILKLTNVIDWSWLWVLSPLWLVPVGMIIFLAGFGVIMLIRFLIIKLK